MQVAFWAGAISLAMTLAVAALITVMRVLQRLRQRRWEAFVAQWRPALTAVTLFDEPAEALPALHRRDRLQFLRLWMYLHESVRGESHERLRALARSFGLHRTVLRRLQARSRAGRLQAVVAAGLLAEPEAWAPLTRLVHARDSLLSVCAARALVQIDPGRAAQVLMPLVVGRTDWDASQVVSALGPARDAIAPGLWERIAVLDAEALPRALRVVTALRVALPDEGLAGLLDPDRPVGVLLAALPLAGSLALTPRVRALLAHDDGQVRALAARQLASLAGPRDVEALRQALHDGYWPARLAAARSLSQLPFVDLRALLAQTPAGSVAADTLRHVLAEGSRA